MSLPSEILLKIFSNCEINTLFSLRISQDFANIAREIANLNRKKYVDYINKHSPDEWVVSTIRKMLVMCSGASLLRSDVMCVVGKYNELPKLYIKMIFTDTPMHIVRNVVTANVDAFDSPILSEDSPLIELSKICFLTLLSPTHINVAFLDVAALLCVDEFLKYHIDLENMEEMITLIGLYGPEKVPNSTNYIVRLFKHHEKRLICSFQKNGYDYSTCKMINRRSTGVMAIASYLSYSERIKFLFSVDNCVKLEARRRNEFPI